MDPLGWSLHRVFYVWLTLWVTGQGLATDLISEATGTVADAQTLAFFESKIRPLLEKKCIECHGRQKQEGGLRLDSQPGWRQGGNRGPALVPGKPAESLLIKAVQYVDIDIQMPPEDRLGADDVALLETWIQQGAFDPRTDVAPASNLAATEWAKAFQKRLAWWSLQPLRKFHPPDVKITEGTLEPVDRFICRSLNDVRLEPASPAEPEILLRRLAFVLTGLPPTPHQRIAFLENWKTNPTTAYETLVDRFLASPFFGERFARHWMDAVRYTDTYGYEWDNPAKGSWEYRDYLIRAFNQDIGFDQLLREQLAGDLLPSPRIDREREINESLIGPAFYHLGEHRHGSSLMFNGIHQDMVNNKIEAFSEAFLATTVACARCHDHKLEAVSQRDYYSLAAVFMTPRWTSRVVDLPGKHDIAIIKLQKLRAQIQREMASRWLSVVSEAGAFLPKILSRANSVKELSEVTIDDVLYPLTLLTKGNTDIEKRWIDFAAEWRQARAKRIEANSEFQILADFRKPIFPDGWVWEGDGIKHGYVVDGTPLIALEGDLIVARLLPSGFHTNALSSKLPGSLRSPPQGSIARKIASVQLAGGEFGGHLVVDGNAFQNETIGFLNSPEPTWISFADTPLKNGVTQVTIELTTASLNPNFPPRTGLAKGLAHTDLGYDKRSWLSITGIVAHEKAETPQKTLQHLTTLFEGVLPRTEDEAVQRVRGWLMATVRRWCLGKSEEGDLLVLQWILANDLLPNVADAGTPLATLLAEYRAVEQGIAHAHTVNSMDERGSAKVRYPLNVRGNVDVLGEWVSPDFLSMFAGRNNVSESRGSGRLELAESLLQPSHPLTSRVYSNRIWQWIFGTGIVASPDDFGHLGAIPSHPELLDYLAQELIHGGWSTKRLVRRLVLSQTFRQSGLVSPLAQEIDPGNRLLHHYSTRRLEAEAIRDSLLSVSGTLNPALFGHPIDPPRVAEDSKKRLFAGPVDGHGRRSLYLKMSIMEPPKFLAGFNLPDLKLPTGRRDMTNDPTQALMMLNDPFVKAMSQQWAEQLIHQPDSSSGGRIATMFIRAFGREPDRSESARWSIALTELTPEGCQNVMTDALAWERLAHVFFNSPEFIYYH
jgi:cytochrome c553